jgi:hypothetical protein
MKIKNLQLINLQLVVLFLTLSSGIFAQKKAPAPNFEEGIIRYGLEVGGANAEEIKRFTNGTTMVWYIKGKDSRFEVSAMNGFAKLQFIRNEDTKMSTLLLDIPVVADKIAVQISDDDEMFKKLQDDSRMPTNTDNPIKFKGSKRIAKQKCKKGTIAIPNSADKMFFYATDKIRPVFGADIFKKMGGFPMGMEADANGMKLKIMATSVEKKNLDAATFAIPEGYEMKTLEEFQEDVKSKMGGGGIGL